MALQHLRSSTADKRPTPGAMSDGQLALNTNLASPGLFFKDSNGDSVKIGPVHVGTTAPNVTPGAGGQAGNSKGEAWLDTTAANPILKVWNGSAFVAVQPVGTGTVVSTTDTGTVTSTMILDGTILNADINASAGIVDTKLATIATAGKVSNSATTAASANTANAIVARDASGDFAAGDITISDKIIHVGDTDTAIRFPAADVVTVETGGSERARIGSSGRLLLGTSTAEATVSLSSASSTPSFQNAATGQAGSSAGLFNWSTASSAAYLNFSKSKSGTIGTRGQVANGNDLGSVLFVGDDGTNFVSSAGIVAQVDGTPGTDNMPGRLVFRTKADGATGTPAEAMRITSAGNVGINTTTPGANLQIGDGSSATVGSTAPYAWVSARALSQSNADTTPQELLRLSWQEGTQDLGVGEGCAINFAASLLVDSGTFYPVASIASFKETTSDSNRSSALTFSTSADGTAAPTEAMRINSAQELLIGYTADNGAYKLQVNSQIFATSATVATSDGRYKENVATLNGCIDLVNALRPVSFDWKPQQDITRINEDGNSVLVREGHNFPDGKQVGFIAQEVQEVIADKPWLGSVIKQNVRPAIEDADGNELAPEEEFFGIAEGNLTAVLTAALQETIAKINALEARIAALEAEVAALKAQ
jgi:hypothetical protein